MNSEDGTASARAQLPADSMKPVLVIGVGSTGARICRRVAEYINQGCVRDDAAPVQCLCIGFPEEKSFRVSESFRYVELEHPADINHGDYDELRLDETWSWLPLRGTEDRVVPVQGSRASARMAFFNAARIIREELVRSIKVLNVQAGTPVSIFVAAGAGDPEGSAMFLDAAALAGDVFAGSASPVFYGMLLMPGFGSGKGQMAGAYALLKETDFFVQGGRMKFSYPDGSSAVMSGKIFSTGKFFLIDRQQFPAPCPGHDRAGIDSAAYFISLMILPPVCGFADADQPGKYPGKNMVPGWSSFGLCRSLNPAAAYIDAVKAHAAALIIDEFFKPVDPVRLLDDLERLNGIPGSPCGPVCADILRKMYPAHAKMTGMVSAEIRGRLETVLAEGDEKKSADVCRGIAGEYSAQGIERFRHGLLSEMRMRASIELEKIKMLLLPEIYAMTDDPERGFYFAVAAIDSISERLSSFHALFSSAASRTGMYTADEFAGGIEPVSSNASDAVIDMAAFNYRQFVYSCMIEASKFFLEEFISALDDIRGSVSERIIVQAVKLRAECMSLAVELARSLKSISGCGCDLPDHEITDFFYHNTSGVIDTPGAAKMIQPSDLLNVFSIESDCETAPYTRLREKFYEAVNIYIESESLYGSGLPAAINVQKQAGWMHVCSEPAVSLYNTNAPQLLKTSAIFSCDPFPAGDAAAQQDATQENTLLRLTVSPGLVLQREAVMIRVVSGYMLDDVSSLALLSKSYHELTSSMTPLHIFSGAENNALYYPDPLGNEYMDPGCLWSALVLLRLIREENGIYIVDESAVPLFRETVAKEKYKRVVTETARRFVESGNQGHAGFDIIGDAVNMLGMLAKGKSGGIVFRRELASAIRDILEARDLQGDKNYSAGVLQEEFRSTAEIASFLEDNPAAGKFILNTIRSIIDAAGRGGAAGDFIMLPGSIIAGTPVPDFENAGEFAGYCLEYGAPGFYSAMKNILTVKLDEYIHARFVKEKGTDAVPVSAIAEFLMAVESRIPLCVINGIRTRYGLSQE